MIFEQVATGGCQSYMRAVALDGGLKTWREQGVPPGG